MIKNVFKIGILSLSICIIPNILGMFNAHADAPGLQVSPLQYADELTPGRVKTGFIDVSNPSDGPVTIETSVRGFRQAGNDGALEFFDDPDLAAGIKVDLGAFDLGGREAVRVGFSVDPGKLPAGGIYAAIFFRTVPVAGSVNTSYVAESANVGTILELTNGPAGPHQGKVTALNMQFWQFGTGLRGNLDYQNTDHSPAPQGFRPNLTVAVLPWGNPPRMKTGLVLPGATRHFEFNRTGAFLGLLPVHVTDQDTGQVTTRWVFAVTGGWQWVVLIILIALVVLTVFHEHWLPHLKRQLRRTRRTRVAKDPVLPARPMLHPGTHPTVTRALLTKLLKPYGVKSFSYELATTGIENTTLLVSAPPAELVVRLYRDGRATRASIETELEFMQKLAEAHVPVATIRADKTGRQIGQYTADGRTWHYIVMDRTPGGHPAAYTDELIAELALYQARIHEVGEAFTAGHRPVHTGDFKFTETFGACLDRSRITSPSALHLFDRAEAFELTLPGSLPSGYSHLDYDKANVLEHGGAISAILDFDDLDYAPFVMCLGYALWDVLGETGDPAQVRRYLEHYEHLRPLTPEEREYLIPVMLFRHYVVTVVDMVLHGVKPAAVEEAVRIESQLLNLTPKDIDPAAPSGMVH